MNQKIKDQVWQEGSEVHGWDRKTRRRDVFGNEIHYGAYGDKKSPYGWDIDHKVPKARGGNDDISNLQPLHREANRKKADK